MVDLLKQKSKIIMQHRERKTFAPADVFKQRKIQEEANNKEQIQPKSNSTNKQAGKEAKKIQPQIIEKYDVEMEKKWSYLVSIII